MKAKKSMVFGGATLMAVLALGLAVFLPAGEVAAKASQCGGDVKIEGGPYVFEAPDGKGIEKVCIKAGTEIYTFECGNTGDGCYKIEWIYDGCYYAKAAIITGGGTSRYCKDISNATATFIVCEE